MLNHAESAPITYTLDIDYLGADSAWLSISPAMGTIPVAASIALLATADATTLAPGDYSAVLAITSNASPLHIPITLHVARTATLETEPARLTFVSDIYPAYAPLITRNTGETPLTYTIESGTSFRVFPHTILTESNSDPVSPGPNEVTAIPNNARPFIGESYDDYFPNFLHPGSMDGQDGWTADGTEWVLRIPYEYGHVIQGRSTGSGHTSMMFSTLVDQGSENISSCNMKVNLLGSKGTTWQFIPQSLEHGQVVTRFQINPDQSLQVLVRNVDGSASFQHIRAILPSEYFDLLFKVDRLTSRFAIFFNGQKVFTGQGFGDHIEQMAFLSLMEREGSSIFIKSFEHYDCSSMIQTDEDWYWTYETSDQVEPGQSRERNFTYTHTDLLPGEYTDSITLTTNDPTQRIVYLPYTIKVDDPYVEPSDWTGQKGLEVLTDSVTATTNSPGDSTTVFVTVRNNGDVAQSVYFPIPVELDHEYRAFYNGAENFQWQDISTSGTKLELGDDDSHSIHLPFVFRISSSVASDYFTISSNGYLVLGQVDASSPINLPFDSNFGDDVYNTLGVYWDDLATDNLSGIYYTLDEERLIVQYHNVLIYGTAFRNTFQVIVYRDGTIKYQYLSMNDGFGASIGLAYGNSAVIGLVANEPFVTDSLAIVFRYEDWGIYDDETGTTFYVIHPWVKYPAPISIPAHSTIEVPVTLSSEATGRSKGNLFLLSYAPTSFNYPYYFQQVDNHAFVIPATLNVLDNPAPVLASLEDVVVVEGTSRDVTISAADANDSTVSIALENAPSFITLKSTTSLSATYSIAPLQAHIGNYAIVVKATDPHGAYDIDTLHVSVVKYSVTSFSMINTETGEVLFDFTNSVTINQADPDFAVLTIRANTSPETVGSVKFKIDGSQINIDNTNPYQLSNRQLLSLKPGTHTILAEPFTDRSGHGNRGESQDATITVIRATNVVVDFSLVNFDDAVSIDRSRRDFMDLNIRANTLPASVGSVKFKIDGTQRNIDSENPFLLKSGLLVSLSSGDYTILAEPYTGTNGHGSRGQSKQAIVTINESPIAVVDFSLVNTVTGEVISHFNNSITVNRNRPDLADLTIRANTRPSEVPSVKFKVNGIQRNIDNTAPYLLMKPLLPTLSTGENTIVAEPYTEPNGHGERGELREAKIILEDLPTTVSFSLVNVVTGQVQETFDRAITIDRLRADFSSLNIRANTVPAIVGSVKFKINGAQRNIDSSSPYMLSNQSLQTIALGTTVVNGEPFTLSSGQGLHGQSLEATITLVEGTTASMKTQAQIAEGSDQATSLEIYPVPVADVLRFKTSEYDTRAFQVAVINVMGQTVFYGQVASGTLNAFELSTNAIGLGSGVYYLHLVDAKGTRTIKKMIKK
jgi:hypothetical protein